MMRALLILVLTQMAFAENWLAYIGTYTTGASKGIYVARYAPDTGRLTPIGLAAQTVSPSFVAAHPNGRWLYAVNESRRYNGVANSGSVSAFTIDAKSGLLTALNVVPSRGADPCHLAIDQTGRWLFVANYSGGSVSVFAIADNGALRDASQVIEHKGAAKVDPLRQEAPHAHSVNVSPDNRFLYVSDLGNDKIIVYAFDAATGKLSPHAEVALPPGTGPRHLTFARDQRTLYSLGELNGTVNVFRHDPATAKVEPLQTISTMPAGDSSPRSGAEIAVDPTGRFLYTSNRGHDSIASFHIAADGRLTATGHTSTLGKTPRNFVIDPAGKHLIAANQDKGGLAIFSIDAQTGALHPVAEPLPIDAPVAITFVKVP
jgi:6-phosphogluconolactonase